MIHTEVKAFKVKSSLMLEMVQCMYEQFFKMHKVELTTLIYNYSPTESIAFCTAA